jgi:hypothetical protein
VTIAKRPFPGRDVASDSADLPDGLSGIFFARGLDKLLVICPSGQFVTPAAAHRHCKRREAIHGAAYDDMDCFVALLLSMTAVG